MIPLNGSTVWVKFKGKFYLGKLIQSNIKLDMFCIRIMNYFNCNNHEKTKQSFIRRSCPDSFNNYLNKTNRNNKPTDDGKDDNDDEDDDEQSSNSIVITCGKEDIYVINDNGTDKMKILNENDDVELKKNEVLSSDESINLNAITPIDNGNSGISDSFKIQNILQNTSITKEANNKHLQQYIPLPYDDDDDDDDNEDYDDEDDKETDMNDDHDDADTDVRGGYKCRHCKTWKKDEHEIKSHVLNAHQLDTVWETENNWVVIGGIEGFNYDEVNYSTENNIKYLNSIHLSSTKTPKVSSSSPPHLSSSSPSSVPSIIRKRHLLLESLPRPLYSSSNMINTSNVTTQSTIDCSHYNLPTSTNIPQRTCPFLNSIKASLEHDISRRLSIGDSIFTDSFEMSTSNSNNRKNSVMSSSTQNGLLTSTSSTSSKNILQTLLTNNNTKLENSDFLLSTYPQNSHKLLINFSNNDPDDTGTGVNNNFSTPPKRSRLDGKVKKCRKMYGIEQRNLWCNQCKWKKACTRFTNDNNGLTKSFNL